MKEVCVLGASGFLGQHLVEGTGWKSVTRSDLDLLDQQAVEAFFLRNRYDTVIHCAVLGGSRLRADEESVTHRNILMFENVVRVFSGTLIYFSSGAALQGTPPTAPYGLSKWIIDRRIETLQAAHSIRIWGCYGRGELSTRFSAICQREGHVMIDQDRYFDFVAVEDVKAVVNDFVLGRRTEKFFNAVYEKKRLLSEWAEFFGATSTIRDTGSLGEPYCLDRGGVEFQSELCLSGPTARE